jgi:hypothetical protein
MLYGEDLRRFSRYLRDDAQELEHGSEGLLKLGHRFKSGELCNRVACDSHRNISLLPNHGKHEVPIPLEGEYPVTYAMWRVFLQYKGTSRVQAGS